MSAIEKYTRRVFIVAELSANHNNDFDLAVRTLEAMANAGADAVKVQTFTPSSITLNVDNEYFGPRKVGLWKGHTLWDLYTKAAMPYEWTSKLKAIAEDLGMVFFSSPFDKDGVDFLAGLDVALYKIASFEITDIPLIRYAASKGKPVIMSTGVAEIADIELALEACRAVGNLDLALLKCTSEYPARVEMANLKTIPDMKERFGVTIGLSDHTPGSIVPIVSVALGARIVEKHFILDRSLGGVDSAFSMEPHEFAEMVNAVREAESSLGEISYTISQNDKLRRRSIFVSKPLQKGEIITEEHIRCVRPGNGAHPLYYDRILGTSARRDYVAGEPFNIEE